MGWSQANVNVLTQKPPPTSDDFAGFPVMHFPIWFPCVPISICYPNAACPKMDDMNALAQLYPGDEPDNTQENAHNHPDRWRNNWQRNGTSQLTGRIYGSVYFTNAAGVAMQPMQGVNVVARLTVNGQPSRQYVVTSVSGFAFSGNAGNIIDGYVGGNGLRFDRWGSDDPSLEGFFDLGQLTIPAGQTIAEYQLSVEALDPDWVSGRRTVCPLPRYRPRARSLKYLSRLTAGWMKSATS